MRVPCIKCKGRNPANCGRTFCPIIAKSEAMFKVKDKLNKEDFYGASPAPFVGRFGYPEINVGILSPPEQKDDAWLHDAPLHWSREEFNIPQIIDLRSALINSRFKANVKEKSDRLLGITQEVGMASKPVDIEVNLKKKPFFRLNTDAYMAPTGPNADLKKIQVTSNPKIHTKVDKVVSDTGLKSVDGLNYLYNKGFDENFLSKLLSVGTLGYEDRRKLVPTRFSITAVDDLIGKQLISNIKNYPVSNYLAYFGGYLGNYFLILFFPEIWSYELFETYMPQASWNINNKMEYTTDYENYYGRKNYAESCIGGYYSNRLGIAEKLTKSKRQASVLALRFITGEYAVPLGVWCVREATRKALKNKPIEFASKELMLNYAKILIKRKFNFDLDKILKNSILLKNMRQQTKLARFL